MKQMTTKEVTELGRDINDTKILMLYSHGFSCVEIARVMGTSESVVRNVLKTRIDALKNIVNNIQFKEEEL